MHLKLVFSNKCFTLSLVLKERVFGTRKWPFRSCNQGKQRYNNRTILNYGTLATLNVNSYGNTLIWYAASLVVNNLFVGIGYFFIYLPWTVAFFVFGFFFSFLQLGPPLISFEEVMLFYILNPKPQHMAYSRVLTSLKNIGTASPII